MDTKLTLKLNETVIERAKKYASEKNVSLSRLIENYLDLITREQKDDFEISPFVRSIATGKAIPDNADWTEMRGEYRDFLDKKYQ